MASHSGIIRITRPALFVAAALSIVLTGPAAAASSQTVAGTGWTPATSGSGRMAAAYDDTATTQGYQTSLLGVSARTADDVWAVGFSIGARGIRGLIRHWDGSAWTTVPSPNFANRTTYLESVTSISANDAWAVGFYSTPVGRDLTLIEHWDGAHWTQFASPNPGPGFSQLQGVTAVSASNLWAVGFRNTGHGRVVRCLTEHFDGRSWVAVPCRGRIGSHLAGVSAAGASNVWAVGVIYERTIDKTLAEHWDGSAWNRVPCPSPPGVKHTGSRLSGVSALSTDDAWAVGSTGRSLIEHWNGQSWVRVPSVDAGTSSALRAVSAVSANDAWAVGSYATATAFKTLIEHWNGTSWVRVASPNAHGADVNTLDGVSAASSSDVWSVGSHHVGHTPSYRGLVEHWDGTGWT